jgi:FtsZ-interacting cell division protein ZipA
LSGSKKKHASQKFGPSVNQGRRGSASKSEKQKKKVAKSLMRAGKVAVKSSAKNSQAQTSAVEISSVAGLQMEQGGAPDLDAWDDRAEEEPTQYPDLEDIEDSPLEVPQQYEDVDGETEEQAYGDYIDDQLEGKASIVTFLTSLGKIEQQATETRQRVAKNNIAEQIVVLYLAPKNSRGTFLGYELLQSLSNYSVHLSEYKHFQRFAKQDGSGELWFHVASRTHPGTFDMREPGKLSCEGLVLILEAHKVKATAEAFECMMETARGLASDLDAQLLDHSEKPLTETECRRLRYLTAKKEITVPV